MNVNGGSQSFDIRLTNQQLRRDAQAAMAQFDRIGQSAMQAGQTIDVNFNRISGAFRSIGVGLAGAFAIERIKSFIGEIINVRSEIQSLSVSFETLLGSKERADQLLGQIRQYAASTPMQLNDLAQGAQTLLGFNVEAKKVMPILQSIGDISMGSRDKFNSLTLAFAQMSATGKLMGQDLLQMINAGFNPLTIISEQTGKSISKLKDEMSAGSISAKMVEDAFRAATAEGGKFHGMLEQQSKTLRGSISNLQGAFSDMLNDFGESTEGIISGGVNAAYSMVKNYKDTAEALLALIGTVGVYKAAVMTEAALNAAVADTTHARIAAIGALNTAQATGIELEIRQAVAKGALTKAEAEELLMQHELAKARVAELTALKAKTQAEKESAIVAQATAAAEVRAAEQQVMAANAKYEAALRSGDAARVENAELALGTAQSELNAASKAHMAAMTNTATASKKASAAAAAADTAAQELNTLSMNTGTKAANFLTVAKTQLRTATAKLYATMTAHPLAMILAAVVALGYGIYKLATHMSATEKAHKALKESAEQAEGAVVAEEAEVRRLFDVLKKAKEGTEAYKKAKDNIWSRYGNYLKQLGDENTALKDQAKAYELVAKKAREAVMAKAKDAFMNSEDAQALTSGLGSTRKKARDLIVKKYGQQFADKHQDDIIRIIEGDATVNAEFVKAFDKTVVRTAGSSNSGYAQTYSAVVNPLKELIEQGKKQRKEIDQLGRDAEIMFGVASDPGDGAVEVENNFSESLAEAKKARDAAKKQWQELAKSTASTKTEVETAYKAYKSAQSAYDELLEMSTGKKEKTGGKSQAELNAEAVAARQKGLNLELAQNLERTQTLKQDEIDLQRSLAETQMEGAAKRQKLRELDIEQEKLDLEKQMRDRIQAVIDGEEEKFNAQEEVNEKEAAARGNDHYARRTFATGNLTVGGLNAGDTITDTSSANVGNLSKDAIGQINSIMALYQTLTSNRVEAMSRELSDEATQAYDEYLRDFGTYLEKRQAMIDIANRNMTKAETEGARKSIAGQLEKDLAALDQEANQKTSAVAQLFSDMTDKTIADMRRIETQGRKALDFLTKGEWNAETGAELGMSEETFNTLRKSPEELEKIRKAIAAIKRETEGCENGFRKFADGLEEIFKAGNDPKKLANALAKIQGGLQEVNQVAGFLSNTLAQLSEAFGSGVLGNIANGISVATDAMNSAMQGAQAGAAFGPWGAAAGAAVGLVSSLGSAIAKLHDAKHERKIQELQDQVEVLEHSYDQLGRAIDKAYSGKAKELIERQNVLLRQKQTLLRQQIAEEKAKKKTDNSKIKEWEKQLQEIENQIADNKEKAIDAIFGEDVKSAIDRFADAYEGMFDGGMSRARASKDLVKQMIKNMVTEAMKADISEPMNRLREMLVGFWSDEKITDWEQSQLNNYVDNILAQQEKKWGWADGVFKESTSQSSSKGGFTTMSQDSADELNGRFTALQIAGEAIKTTLADVNELLRTAAARSAVAASAVDEIRGLTLLAVDHLDAIRKHTAHLQEMNERLGKIEKYTSRI